jgi:hypothetical protein
MNVEVGDETRESWCHYVFRESLNKIHLLPDML